MLSLEIEKPFDFIVRDKNGLINESNQEIILYYSIFFSTVNLANMKYLF